MPPNRADVSPKVLSPSEESVMDKMNALGTPLGDWGIETDCLVESMCANAFTSRGSDSDLFKYLYAIMNSSLIRWFLQSSRPPMKEGEIEPAPIPKITPAEQRPFIHLVDQILKAKAADPDADTSELEESIDWLVYDLYDLTDEETAVIADYFWEGEMSLEEEDAAFVKMMEEASKEEGFVSREEIMAILRGEDEG